MVIRTVSEAVFACHSSACRPPTSGGTGGSSPSGSKGRPSRGKATGAGSRAAQLNRDYGSNYPHSENKGLNPNGFTNAHPRTDGYVPPGRLEDRAVNAKIARLPGGVSTPNRTAGYGPKEAVKALTRAGTDSLYFKHNGRSHHARVSKRGSEYEYKVMEETSNYGKSGYKKVAEGRAPTRAAGAEKVADYFIDKYGY